MMHESNIQGAHQVSKRMQMHTGEEINDLESHYSPHEQSQSFVYKLLLEQVLLCSRGQCIEMYRPNSSYVQNLCERTCEHKSTICTFSVENA